MPYEQLSQVKTVLSSADCKRQLLILLTPVVEYTALEAILYWTDIFYRYFPEVRMIPEKFALAARTLAPLNYTMGHNNFELWQFSLLCFSFSNNSAIPVELRKSAASKQNYGTSSRQRNLVSQWVGLFRALFCCNLIIGYIHLKSYPTQGGVRCKTCNGRGHQILCGDVEKKKKKRLSGSYLFGNTASIRIPYRKKAKGERHE